MKSLGMIRASVLATGFFFPGVASAGPAVVQTFTSPAAAPSRIASPSDWMPWYTVPDRYLFSGGYYVDLNIKEMRIDHVAYNSRCTRRNRTFMISASYGQPIGNQLFSSVIELPLVSADRFSLTRLAPAAVGDYVVHLANTPMDAPILGFAVATRF